MKVTVTYFPNNATEKRDSKGELHCADGPAKKSHCGAEEWYIHGLLHRADGPAIIQGTGNRFWYEGGKLHRTDGPAVEYRDGRREWFAQGRQVPQGAGLVDLASLEPTIREGALIMFGKQKISINDVVNAVRAACI